MSIAYAKQQLRQQLREQRRALSRQQQQQAAIQLDRQLACSPEFIRARRIGFYMATDGEISTQLLLQRATSMDKACFLPSLRKDGGLDFRLYEGEEQLVTNRYGIVEATGDSCPLWLLDILLIPLVGFDTNGNRLGMGAGFYDRSLSTLQGRPRKPLLWGLAHSCQQVDSIPTDKHDQPLDRIISISE